MKLILNIYHHATLVQLSFMKLKINHKQIMATSAGDINSPNLLVCYSSVTMHC